MNVCKDKHLILLCLVGFQSFIIWYYDNNLNLNVRFKRKGRKGAVMWLYYQQICLLVFVRFFVKSISIVSDFNIETCKLGFPFPIVESFDRSHHLLHFTSVNKKCLLIVFYRLCWLEFGYPRLCLQFNLF